MDSLKEQFNNYFFLKNWYSFYKHLIPFAFTALLLLLLSLPADNLLLRLANRLENPVHLLLPAASVTIITLAIYLATLRAQIRKAYLWADYDWCRTIITSLIYLAICGAMTYVVLRNSRVDKPEVILCSALFSKVTDTSLLPAMGSKNLFGDAWTCLLLSLLSLTGVGWTQPSSWVETIGITIPDYTQGRLAVKNIDRILSDLRNKPQTEKRIIENFLEETKLLKDSIDKNLIHEPKWIKGTLKEISGILGQIIQQVQNIFLAGTNATLASFASVCQGYKYSPPYKDFIDNLSKVSSYWPQWTPSKLNRRKL